MKQSLVSIVLPIYGVEKYLDRCMNSVVNQTYRNLEIIMVDDGSRDNCPAMCEQWAAKDSRIKVIHKENAGLGMARNTGIENATGEYICFFDSDDYVALDTIEKAVALVETEGSDIVLFGLANVDINGQVVDCIIPRTQQVTCCGESVQEEFLPDLIATVSGSSRQNLYMSACLCLYSVNMIHESGWRFASEREIISEDVYSLLCLYRHVNRVSVLPEALYFYCENASSLSRSYRKDRFDRICHFHSSIIRKANELGYCQEVSRRFQCLFVAFVTAAMKAIMTADCSEAEKRLELRKIVKSDYIRDFSWDAEMRTGTGKRKLFELCLRKQWYWACYAMLKAVCR